MAWLEELGLSTVSWYGRNLERPLQRKRSTRYNKNCNKLSNSKVPGYDEICPEMLMALDVVRIWLPYFFNDIRRTGTHLWNGKSR